MPDSKQTEKPSNKTSSEKVNAPEVDEMTAFKAKQKTLAESIDKIVAEKAKIQAKMNAAQKEYDDHVIKVPQETHAERVRAIQQNSAKEREAKVKARQALLEQGVDPELLAKVLK